MSRFQKNDVVQFNENHKWCGSIGIVDEVKEIDNNVRYMVGIPIPEKGTALIFVRESENALEYIGKAVMINNFEEEE